MEQKVDQMAAEVTKRQLEREESALQYKRYLLGWTYNYMHDEVVLDHPLHPPCLWGSLIEQKVDQMAAELTKRQLEREDTALQYKRYLPSWA